jgi:hypothetical protein
MIIEKYHHCVGSQTCENQVVNECLPVSAFGDAVSKSVKVATIGLNPALNEFFDSSGRANHRSLRLAILNDYQLSSRADLHASDVVDAKTRRESYFREDREWHSYFEKLESVISRIDPSWSYSTGRAVHLDLVACATKVRWSDLANECKSELISNCRIHFLKTLNDLPSGTLLLLDGSRVANEISLLPKHSSEATVLQITKKTICHVQGEQGCVGTLKLGDKEFPFRGWPVPAGKLTLLSRYNLAYWVCGTFSPPC